MAQGFNHLPPDRMSGYGGRNGKNAAIERKTWKQNPLDGWKNGKTIAREGNGGKRARVAEVRRGRKVKSGATTSY